MELVQAIQVYQEYHRMNSGKNTTESYGATLTRLGDHFGNDLVAITSEEVLSFLNKINEKGKQQT